jgi:hypothetical protein
LVFSHIYNTGDRGLANYIQTTLKTPFLEPQGKEPSSHDILGTLSTLGSLPVDVLSRHLDITGLAVNAARRKTVSQHCISRLDILDPSGTGKRKLTFAR